MLQRVVRPDKAEVHFKYDALGRRLEKQYKKTITKFVWDGNKPLHEWKEFDAKEATADELITWVFNEDDLTPTAKIKGEKKYSIVTDHLGTPVQGYNETGELIWDRELDSYGKIRMLKGDEGFCNYLYQGQTLDPETGLAYNRFRYYDPEEGRYVSQDPIEFESNELNFYSYVRVPNIEGDIFGLETSYQRRKAVREAWKQELNLIKKTGRGTRSWTKKEIAEMKLRGKVKGYEGHHINNVANNPKLAGNPNNIKFVKGRTEHLAEHNGNFANPTKGKLINRTNLANGKNK